MSEKKRIHISPSLTADTRTCEALGLFQSLLTEAAVRHDKETGWWDNHRKVNRHHLGEPDGIPEDVNLIDVLDYVADCCMSGLARSGSVYELHLPDELLQRAFQNTVRLLINATEVA